MIFEMRDVALIVRWLGMLVAGAGFLWLRFFFISSWKDIGFCLALVVGGIAIALAANRVLTRLQSRTPEVK